RRRPVDARGVRADDRDPAVAARAAARAEGLLGDLSAARRVGHRRDREPLHRRRRARRRRRGPRSARRPRPRPRPPAGLDVPARPPPRARAPERPRGALMAAPEPQPEPSTEPSRPRPTTPAAERREIYRNKLIESRLTPN